MKILKTNSKNLNPAFLLTYFLVILLTLTFSSLSSAHTKLTESIPAADAKLNESPRELVVVFGTDVQLMNLKLKMSNGQAIEFGFKPSSEANKRFSFTLPRLEQGSYRVDWSILGADGHKMTGNFDFSLTP